ncbi:MAG: biopolymer transporter ExbD [Sandaracinaceae bacterium]|nr:biopolymer transporter ExbD [Sandaracinaceae bacterium]
MSTGSSGGRAPLSEINVTPLVDVMLVLLIIFMVAAPMMTAGVDIDLPQANAPRMDIDEQKLLLTIDREERIFLGEDEIPSERLEDVLLHNERLQREREIFVQADTNVPYGVVVRVLAILRRAGVEDLGLVTDPMGAGGTPVPSGATGSLPRPSPTPAPTPAP